MYKELPLETLIPGKIITITEGFYHNALGVYKVLKSVTHEVIIEAAGFARDKIDQETMEELGEFYPATMEEISEALPGVLVKLGYLEKINAVELHLGDGKIEPVIFED